MILTRLAIARLTALLLIVVLIASCDNMSTNPRENNEKPKEPVDSTGFAIVASTSDTLYYGEEAWIQVKELGSDKGVLRLFVHTVEVSANEMRIDGDRLVFNVPRNASTGKLRLYKHDTLLAKNNFTLHVLSHHVNEFNTTPRGYWPTEGYPEETIRIHVFDLPLRRSEFDVLLDNEKLKVITWDSVIIAEVPHENRRGVLTLRVFNQFFELGPFEVLKHGGTFLEEGKVRSISIQTFGLLGQTASEFQEGDSSFSFTVPGITFHALVAVDTFAGVTRSDSLRFSSSYRDSFGEYTAEVGFKLATGRNMASGRITITSLLNEGTSHEQTLLTTVTLKDISWKRVSNSYILYADGESVTQNVSSLNYESRGKTFLQKMVQYSGGDGLSFFRVSFEIPK